MSGGRGKGGIKLFGIIFLVVIAIAVFGGEKDAPIMTEEDIKKYLE